MVTVGLSESIHPTYVESYRIIYVGHSKKFHLSFQLEFLGLYEVFFFIGIGFLFAHRILTYQLFRNITLKFKEKSYLFTMVSVSLGQGKFKLPKLYSVGIITILYSFFVFFNYVVETSFIISLLTTDPPVKFRSFDAVQKSGIEIFTFDYDFDGDYYRQLTNFT